MTTPIITINPLNLSTIKQEQHSEPDPEPKRKINWYDCENVYKFKNYKKQVEEWKTPKWDWYKIFDVEWGELQNLLLVTNVRKDVIQSRHTLLWNDFSQKAMAHKTFENFSYLSPAFLRTIGPADTVLCQR